MIGYRDFDDDHDAQEVLEERAFEEGKLTCDDCGSEKATVYIRAPAPVRHMSVYVCENCNEKRGERARIVPDRINDDKF